MVLNFITCTVVTNINRNFSNVTNWSLNTSSQLLQIQYLHKFMLTLMFAHIHKETHKLKFDMKKNPLLGL